MSIDTRLKQVFADLFDVDPNSLSDNASPETIESWDSVAHLGLVFALEAEFDIQFDVEEIPSLVSFAVIRERLAGEVAPDE